MSVESSTATVETTSPTWIRPACPEVNLVDDDARIADPSLDEVSGAAASAWDPAVVWVIEDSGNPAVVTALSPAGQTLSSLSVDVSNTDWEDLARADDADGRSHLFIGDIGDNGRARAATTVLRVPEPDPHDGSSDAAPAVITLARPTPADAEALMVDPLNGDIVLVTKAYDGRAEVLLAAGAAWADDGSTIDLASGGELRLGLLSPVLAGDLAPDGSAVALRTPTQMLWWPRDPAETVAETLLGSEPCALESVTDIYGEALALGAERGYVLTGEGVGARLITATRR